MDKRRCGVEVFARVTGFFRPVEAWNKGKQEEFKERRHYEAEERCENPKEGIKVPNVY